MTTVLAGTRKYHHFGFASEQAGTREPCEAIVYECAANRALKAAIVRRFTLPRGATRGTGVVSIYMDGNRSPEWNASTICSRLRCPFIQGGLQPHSEPRVGLPSQHVMVGYSLKDHIVHYSAYRISIRQVHFFCPPAHGAAMDSLRLRDGPASARSSSP